MVQSTLVQLLTKALNRFPYTTIKRVVMAGVTLCWVCSVCRWSSGISWFWPRHQRDSFQRGSRPPSSAAALTWANRWWCSMALLRGSPSLLGGKDCWSLMIYFSILCILKLPPTMVYFRGPYRGTPVHTVLYILSYLYKFFSGSITYMKVKLKDGFKTRQKL